MGLAWVTLEEYFHRLPIPDADTIFAPKILAPNRKIYQAKLAYDSDLKLVEWTEY